MVQPNSGDPYGLPVQGYTPYGALDAMYPYLTFGPNLALQLAQMQFQSQNAAQQNAAQLADAQMRAQATLGAAQIGAAGGIGQQQIASAAQLQGLQASIAADIQRAAGGDQNAANRLQAELGLQAQIANQQTGLSLAKMGGSGDLRDNFARMLYLGGQGAQPGMFSAMNGLPSPWVTAPNVAFSGYGAAPKVNMNLPNVSLPNVSMPSINAGSFGGGNFNASGAYSAALAGLPSWMQQPSSIFGFNPTTLPQPAVPPNANLTPYGHPYVPTGNTLYNNILQQAGLPQGATAADIFKSDWYNNLAPADQAQTKTNVYLGTPGANENLLGEPKVFAARGGMKTMKPGDTILVGEGLKGEGLRAGTAEIVSFKDGKIVVTPMHRMAAGGSVVPGTSHIGTAALADPNAEPTTWNPFANFTNPYTKNLPYTPSGFTSFGTPNPVTGTPAGGSPDIKPPTYDAGLPGAPPAPPAGTTGGNDKPSTIKVTELPFLKELFGGAGLPGGSGVGPAWSGNIPRPTAPELGINTGVPLPFEVSARYHQMNPMNQQSALQLWQALGIPPEWAQYWIQQSTPGYRSNPVQALGF